jgi:hypothetical protein
LDDARFGNIFEDISRRPRARPATSSKITLSGLQTVDSIALKDRALAMNQATAAGSQE